MRLSTTNDRVFLELPEAWLNAPEQAAIAEWISNVGTSRPIDGGHVLVELSFDLWHTWAALPSENASEEELDIWTSRHETLARLAGLREQRLDIETVGHIQSRDLELVCRVDGEKVAAGVDAPVLAREPGARLLLPAVFETLRRASAVRPGMDRPAQLEAIGKLKMYATRARRLLAATTIPITISFDDHLDTARFEHVEKAALLWTTSGRNNDLYNLTVEVPDSARGGFKKLPIEHLDSTAPVISVSGKEHILLSEEVATVARLAKKNRNKLRKQVSEALADPTKILPPGFAFDNIDLSRYSPRVTGFEPVICADRPIDIRPSGVAWYADDGDGAPFLRLDIAQADGSVATLEFSSPEEVRETIQNLEKASAAPGTVLRIHDKDVAPTPPLLDCLRETLDLYGRRKLEAERKSQAETSEEEDAADGAGETKRKKGRLAAIIKDVDEAIPLTTAGEVDESDVPWADLASVLRPGIELKPHQRQGVAWLWHHRKRGRSGVLLADDMGLGKTLQIATFLALSRLRLVPEGEKRLPSLIVAPVILLENWRRELAKFFQPHVFAALLTLHDGGLRERVRSGVLDVTGLDQFDWVLTNYETLARFQQQLLSVDFDTVVLDEAQAIKNPDALRTRAARGIKRRFAICATGTPVENRLLDLWTLYDFLSPGQPFGSRDDFERRFENDVQSGITSIRAALKLHTPSSTLLRRTKADALRSLPPKEERVLPIPMTEEQVSLERIVTSDRNRSILEKLHDLQKLYQHPRLLKRAEGVERRRFSADEIIAESPKLAKVIQLLEEIRALGEKAIVFTLWTAMQELLAQVLKARLGLPSVPIINGETNQRGGAQRRIDELESTPGFAVIVLSPLAAGTGLTITAANHVVHYGRWWNPAKEDQATDRAYRIGQTKPVFVHYPVLHHPDDPNRGFDVKLHALVAKKRAMARDFLDPRDQGELTERDLAEMEASA